MTEASAFYAPTRKNAWRTRGIAALLLGLFAVQAVLAMRHKNVTTDEIFYITAGYHHLRTGDFYFNATNPPLAKIIAATPLLAYNLELPKRDTAPREWSIIEQWQYSRDFLYHNTVDADRILFTARLPVVALGLVLGVYLFRWSGELFGTSAALLATALFAFSPNMLAHAQLATQDFALATFVFIAAYYFWRYWNGPTLRSLLFCGVACGFALLTKTSAVFLAPVFALYALAAIARGQGGIDLRWPWVRGLAERQVRLRQLGTATTAAVVIAAIVITVLNAGYGFSPCAARDAGSSRVVADKLPLPRPIGRTLAWICPAPFIRMARGQEGLVATAGPTYFAGKLHNGGVWYQMLASVALKTPVPALVLFALGAILFVAGKAPGAGLSIAMIAVLLAAFSVLSKINVGLRYVLPVFPAMFLVAGAVLAGPRGDSTAWRAAALAGCGWAAVNAALIYPHHLAYFNELAGGPKQGYRWLVDSNLDWGQDLKGLGEWMRRQNVPRVALAYFGSADADHYQLAYDYLPSVGLAPRTADQKWWYEDGAGCTAPIELPDHEPVAISATLLESPGFMASPFGPCYAALRQREPDDMVGYSILIFRFDKHATAAPSEQSQ